MKKEVIKSAKAPAAIGPYSQAIKTGNLMFCSGIIPVDPATGVIAEGIEAQTRQVMENIKGLLGDNGADMSDIVKTTVFIKNMNDFAKINAIYGEYFTADPPARGCVEVARLPKDVLIEIECIVAL